MVTYQWDPVKLCDSWWKYHDMGVSIDGGSPIAGWFIMENPVKNGWSGGTPFLRNRNIFLYTNYHQLITAADPRSAVLFKQIKFKRSIKQQIRGIKKKTYPTDLDDEETQSQATPILSGEKMVSVSIFIHVPLNQSVGCEIILWLITLW